MELKEGLAPFATVLPGLRLPRAETTFVSGASIEN
jgi:hypothetical protein